MFLAAAALVLVPGTAWLDRAAVAAATLLAADAWFDVVTSRGAAAVALAATEAIAVELPVALLCLWLVRGVRPRRAGSALPATTTTTRNGAFG